MKHEKCPSDIPSFKIWCLNQLQTKKGEVVDFSHSHTDFLVFPWHLLPSLRTSLNHWFHCEPVGGTIRLCTKHWLTISGGSVWSNIRLCCHSHMLEKERERERPKDKERMETRGNDCFDFQSQRGVSRCGCVVYSMAAFCWMTLHIHVLMNQSTDWLQVTLVLKRF